MHPKHFSGFTFIGNAQSQIFESQECIRTKPVEELYDQKGCKQFFFVVSINMRSPKKLSKFNTIFFVATTCFKIIYVKIILKNG